MRLADLYELMAETRLLATNKAFQKAKDAVTKALELDESLGEAHASLARIDMNLDWDWRGAERELKRAIELNANIGHMFYSAYLLFVGRPQDALLEAQRADEIDPLSGEVQGFIAMICLGAREYDRSVQKARAPGAQRAAKVWVPALSRKRWPFTQTLAR